MQSWKHHSHASLPPLLELQDVLVIKEKEQDTCNHPAMICVRAIFFSRTTKKKEQFRLFNPL